MSIKGMFLEKKKLFETDFGFLLLCQDAKTCDRFIFKNEGLGQGRNEPDTYNNPTYLNFDKSSQHTKLNEEIIIEIFSSTCIFKPICTRKCTSICWGKLRCLRFITKNVSADLSIEMVK